MIQIGNQEVTKRICSHILRINMKNLAEDLEAIITGLTPYNNTQQRTFKNSIRDRKTLRPILV